MFSIVLTQPMALEGIQLIRFLVILYRAELGTVTATNAAGPPPQKEGNQCLPDARHHVKLYPHLISFSLIIPKPFLLTTTGSWKKGELIMEFQLTHEYSKDAAKERLNSQVSLSGLISLNLNLVLLQTDMDSLNKSAKWS